jgi:GxxExxY protein
MTPEPGSALTEKIIGLAMKVHRSLGPGLMESVYNHCLSWELQQQGLRIEREVALPLVYNNQCLEKAFQAESHANGLCVARKRLRRCMRSPATPRSRLARLNY